MLAGGIISSLKLTFARQIPPGESSCSGLLDPPFIPKANEETMLLPSDGLPSYASEEDRDSTFRSHSQETQIWPLQLAHGEHIGAVQTLRLSTATVQITWPAFLRRARWPPTVALDQRIHELEAKQ